MVSLAHGKSTSAAAGYTPRKEMIHFPLTLLELISQTISAETPLILLAQAETCIGDF